MARTADHDARREQMSSAAIDIALSDGISRVTVARVAAAAGVSVGLVQHYFPTKRALMTRVYDTLLARADQRVADVVEAGEAAGRSIREMTVDALSELLPLDDDRTAECLARIELETMAVRDKALRDVATRHSRSLQTRLGNVVENAKRCGETPPQSDPPEAAAILWAAVVGATQSRLLQPDFAARRVIEDGALSVFPDRCRQHR